MGAIADVFDADFEIQFSLLSRVPMCEGDSCCPLISLKVRLDKLAFRFIELKQQMDCHIVVSLFPQ
jgi:hypothetical protein